MSSFTENSYRNFEAVTGIPWTSRNILRLGNGDLLYQKEELEEGDLVEVDAGKGVVRIVVM